MSGHRNGSTRADKIVAEIDKCDEKLLTYRRNEKMGADKRNDIITIRARKEMLIAELKRIVQFWSVIPTYIEEIILSSTL
uniref:AsIV-cont00152-ORF1 n=1 Tax=Apophua simplicipes ichnovirus TaxID=1329648 RepID=S5DMR4_9VIRU|nr:AsIV-cont00152-ORF1 [Apophua simplicipes ichnovirus]